MDDRNSSRQMIGTFVFLLVGPIAWALNLTLIYGAQSSLCAFGALSPTAIRILVGIICLALAGCVLGAMARPAVVFQRITGASAPEDQWPFIRGTMRLLAGLSVLAMLYFALASLFVPGCDVLR